MQSRFIVILFFVFTVLIFQTSRAQTFGFGCLGFVGGYGGFTYQQYDAKGLNNYIMVFYQNPSISNPMKKIDYLTGYRLGINFFRATFEGGLIISAKGFYQSISKKNKANWETDNGTVNSSLDLDIRNWALGVDLGWEFTKLVSWKIVDAALLFNNVELTQTDNFPGETNVDKYKSDGSILGYSIGTGIIIAVVKDYISIEGLAGYTNLKVDEVKDESGIPFSTFISSEKQNFIDSGGFTAVVQLNVGFPL